MRHIKDARPTTEVIVVSAHGSTTRAVEATKAGAFDFVDKPLNFEELELRVQNALKHRELLTENANLRRQLSTRSEYFNIRGDRFVNGLNRLPAADDIELHANGRILRQSGTRAGFLVNASH